ncbi:MAG: T9SS type A sorting domain-containing protein [Rhodothermales bacterium]
MRWIFRALVVLVLFGVAATPVLGQQERGPIENALFPDVKPRKGPASAAASASAAAARSLALDDEHRVVAGRVQTLRTSHTTYRQVYAGLPVVGRWARVSTDLRGRIRFVSSGFAKPSKDDDTFDAFPVVSGAEAEQSARMHISPGGATTGTAVLSVFLPGTGGAAGASGEPVLVWDVLVWPDHEPAEWQVLVDARTGRVLLAEDRALRHKSTDHGSTTSRSTADGVGTVFDPNPLVTSGASYGAPWVDASDAANPFLDGELREVVLRDLSTNAEGKYVLEGPYVRIDGSQTGGGMAYTPPALSNPTGFRYTRSDEHFEAVMAYYHLDANQRYLQSLGFMDRQNAPLSVHPRAVTRDDSFYLPSLNRLMFGLGGVDDAEDATVIWHEYGHALLEAAAPGLSATLEGIAVHEGWSDYWTASQARALVESGAAARQDWRRLFKWDSGDGTIWSGRTMDHAGTYPADTCSDNVSPGSCSPHNDGRLLATTLMEVQDVLGRDVTDRLVLHSHAYLTAPLTFAQAAEAILQADVDFFDAAHVGVLLSIFDPRGLVDASSWGPVLQHEAVPNTEVGTPSVDVVLDVITGASAPQSVVLMASGTRLGEQQLDMGSDGTGSYRVELGLPTESDTIQYWFRVTDAAGGVSTLPASAPSEQFSFLVGVDTTPPTLQHTPLTSGNLVSWPEVVNVSASDLFGVDRVEVEYTIAAAEGTPLAEGSFLLVEDGVHWSAAFPVPFSVMRKDAVVSYRVTAWDRAASPNKSETPWHSFSISASGLLRRIGLVAPTVTTTGAWTLESANAVPFVVPEEGTVGSWTYGIPSTDVAGLHALTLPSIRLDRVEEAWLTYWYRVDAEASGPIDPLTGGPGQAFDGLQVQAARGDGPWETSTPAEGYPTVVASGTGNPLGGQPSFGGSTHGWRFAAHPVPTGSDVRVKFVVGTDNGNSEPVPDGFRVTDVRFWSELPADAVPPEVTTWSVPERIGLMDGALITPIITLVARDDAGVTDAYMDVRQGGALTSHRLWQDPASLVGFSAPLVLATTPEPGERVDIRLRLQDPWGNETVIPSVDSWITSTVVLQQERPLLAAAAAFSGWSEAENGTWVVRGRDVAGDRASLNIMPILVPSNSGASELRLEHAHDFPAGSGGVVQVSLDDGMTWTPLVPEGGYPGPMRLSEAHPLSGMSGYRGIRPSSEDRFDMTQYPGQRVWIRFLYVEDAQDAPSTSEWYVRALTLVAETEEAEFELPTAFALDTAYPNPFRTAAEITWSLDTDVDTRVAVYDMLGRRVMILADGPFPAGTHRATLDGSRLASGVYVVRLEAEGRFLTRTIVRQ